MAAWVLTWLPGQRVKQGRKRTGLEMPGKDCSSHGGDGCNGHEEDLERLETKA